MNILNHAHSGIRWILLLLLITTVVTSFQNIKKGINLNKDTNKLGLYTLIFVHIQLLIGLVLYLKSDLVHFSGGVMKDSLLRFYTVEHIFMMVIAIILITIGYVQAKRAASWKKQFTFYLIALILILLAIPWPFRELEAGWF